MNKPFNNQVTLASAGTEQQVYAYNADGYMHIKALSGNSGVIYIGETGVTSSNGYPLAAGEYTTVAGDLLSKHYFDGSNTGDKIAILGGFTTF